MAPVQEGTTTWRHDDADKPSKVLANHFEGLWWGNRGETYEVWPSRKVDGLWELERHNRSGKMRFTTQYNERSGLVWWGLRSLFFFDPEDMTSAAHMVTWYSAKDRNKTQPAFVWRKDLPCQPSRQWRVKGSHETLDGQNALSESPTSATTGSSPTYAKVEDPWFNTDPWSSGGGGGVGNWWQHNDRWNESKPNSWEGTRNHS